MTKCQPIFPNVKIRQMQFRWSFSAMTANRLPVSDLNLTIMGEKEKIPLYSVFSRTVLIRGKFTHDGKSALPPKNITI